MVQTCVIEYVVMDTNTFWTSLHTVEVSDLDTALEYIYYIIGKYENIPDQRIDNLQFTTIVEPVDESGLPFSTDEK